MEAIESLMLFVIKRFCKASENDVGYWPTTQQKFIITCEFIKKEPSVFIYPMSSFTNSLFSSGECYILIYIIYNMIKSSEISTAEYILNLDFAPSCEE